MIFAKLTRPDGEPVYVGASLIITETSEQGSRTRIRSQMGDQFVREKVDNVVAALGKVV